MSRRLHVAVPRAIGSYPRASGVGKMWHHVLAELRVIDDVRLLDPARRRARWWRPQVWLCDGHQGPLAARTPVVAQLHEAAWDQPDTRATLAADFVARYDESSRAAARAATRVVTPSESSRAQIVAAYGISPDRVVVAPHGVDPTVFHPRAAGGPEIIAHGGGDPKRPYVLFVSQLHPRKNVGVLVEAMARLGRRGYPHALVLVSGPRVDDADSGSPVLASEPGSSVVHLQGLSEPDLAGVMARASVFCLPSLMEGFGLTALEAMACAVPVVVSDRGALPEVVGNAGVVTAPTADAVEEGLAQLLHDETRARSLGQAGHEWAQQFTWARTAAMWQQAVEEAAADA